MPDSQGLASLAAASPTSFEKNNGQFPAEVLFMARTAGQHVFVTRDRLVFVPAGPGPASPVTMRWQGSAGAASIEGAQRQETVSNYMVGDDPSKWVTGAPHFGKVAAAGIYPGVDLVLYGAASGGLEYDVVVHPGADVEGIRLAFEGVGDLRIDASGRLVAEATAGGLAQEPPRSFQRGPTGAPEPVASAFRLLDARTVGFEVGPHDPSRDLVIDPIVYSTYMGGIGEDVPMAVAVDWQGNAYVTGMTYSPRFPTGAGDLPATTNRAFVTKLNPAGTAAAYRSAVGGSGADEGRGIAVDGAGWVYLAGSTSSTNFPLTTGPAYAGGWDVFVVGLDASGALVRSRLVGGPGGDEARALALTPGGDSVVTGVTYSPYGFGGTYGGQGDAFVATVDTSWSGPWDSTWDLASSSYLGGSGADEGRGVTVDSGGGVHVVGTTASAGLGSGTGVGGTKAAGRDAFLWSGGTFLYLGGVNGEEANDVAVDGDGTVWVVGGTGSPDFFGSGPQDVLTGDWDAFIVKVFQTGISDSKFLGGPLRDEAVGVAISPNGQVVVAGYTASPTFPTTVGAPQPALRGSYDAFLVRLTPGMDSILYSTYLGGSAQDTVTGMALEPAGKRAVLAGVTYSGDFPTLAVPPPPFIAAKPGAQESDGFVAKIEPREDTDGDLVDNEEDNCPTVPNPDQRDSDGDGPGDACDPDDDNDGICDPTQTDATCTGSDNCQFVPNTDQADNEDDLQGDACDPDDDNDGICDPTQTDPGCTGSDNCPSIGNTNQANSDTDAQGDACDPDDDNDTILDGSDNCPTVQNQGQANNDGDAQGDACDNDDDNDGIPDPNDNCRTTPNPDQLDTDKGGAGDLCDPDDDQDGIPDANDNCPLRENTGQQDLDQDGQGDACEPPFDQFRSCSDGFDNDGDGRIDWPADTDCTNPSDTTETQW